MHKDRKERTEEEKTKIMTEEKASGREDKKSAREEYRKNIVEAEKKWKTKDLGEERRRNGYSVTVTI